MVPFRAGCPRCDIDLRDLQEPRCPQCGLDFDWGDVLPLEELTCPTCDYRVYGLAEPQCPECGGKFDWQEALSRHHARRLPLFEYHFRRSFVGSVLRTWLAACRPRRLWQKLELHHAPHIGPLILLTLLCLLAMALVLTIVDAVVQWRMTVIWWSLYSPRAAVTSGYGWRFFVRIMEEQLNEAPALFAVFLVWAASGLASLLLFVQSMVRHRVRPGHIVRIWVYSVMVPIPALAALMIVVMWLVLEVPNQLGMIGPVWPASLTYEEMGRLERIVTHICGLLVIAFVSYSIACGYRHYLRFRHAMLMALASQMIALLVTALGANWIFGANVGAMTVLRVGRAIGLPV